MRKVGISVFKAPRSREEMPTPRAQAGFLLEVNAGWRTSRPVLDGEKCVMCMQCYIVCPEGAIYKNGEALSIDYDFCKGCGICVGECKKSALTMIPEEE